MIASQERGSPGAPSVVFIHGLIASGWMWQEQASLLSEYHILIPDLPGHGGNRHVPWSSIENTAGQIANLIQERATRGRAHLVGLSLGSLVALRVMSLTPEHVRRVIVSGTNLLPLPLRLRVLNLVLLPFLKSKRFVRMAVQGLRLPPDSADSYRESVRAISRRTVLKITRQIAAYNIPANLRSENIPALVVAGELENPLIHRSMQLLLSTLPRAKAYLAPAGHHEWLGEDPDLFARMARAWFEQAPLPPELIPVDTALPGVNKPGE